MAQRNDDCHIPCKNSDNVTCFDRIQKACSCIPCPKCCKTENMANPIALDVSCGRQSPFKWINTNKQSTYKWVPTRTCWQPPILLRQSNTTCSPSTNLICPENSKKPLSLSNCCESYCRNPSHIPCENSVSVCCNKNYESSNQNLKNIALPSEFCGSSSLNYNSCLPKEINKNVEAQTFYTLPNEHNAVQDITNCSNNFQFKTENCNCQLCQTCSPETTCLGNMVDQLPPKTNLPINYLMQAPWFNDNKKVVKPAGHGIPTIFNCEKCPPDQYLLKLGCQDPDPEDFFERIPCDDKCPSTRLNQILNKKKCCLPIVKKQPILPQCLPNIPIEICMSNDLKRILHHRKIIQQCGENCRF